MATRNHHFDCTLVRIPTATVVLEANLSVPSNARGVVAYAHCAGSSRHESRSQHVALALQQSGMATVLVDLLTPSEDLADMNRRFMALDIDLLASRLVCAVDWVGQYPATRDLPVGLFGVNAAGGAVLVAAAQRRDTVRAVVSQAGRPDLAGAWLALVLAPTLLCVGEFDDAVLELNRDSVAEFRAPLRLAVISSATHRLEEQGALETMATWAREWFTHHLSWNPVMPPPPHGSTRRPPRPELD